jgi:hypothetical protein
MTVETVRRVILEGDDVLSNEAFLAKYAKAGRVGLVGGESFIEQMIRRAQRRQLVGNRWSQWGHAFLFEGERVDGQHWVIESDLDVHRERAMLGVQENHVSKYHDDDAYTALAVLDFGLDDAQIKAALTEGLRLLTTRTQYSLREIAALYWKLKNPTERTRENRLSRGDRAIFCSAFVQHLYQTAAQIDFAPDVDTKLTTLEDIWQTHVPHTAYVQIRAPKEKKQGRRGRLLAEKGA